MSQPDSMPDQLPFASDNVRWFWRYISSSLDRLVDTMDGLSVEELNWRPPAPYTNSVHVLIIHTLANAQENILGTLCGQDVERHREQEFGEVAGNGENVTSSWLTIRASLERAVAGVRTAQLSESCDHPRRGQITGRDVLMIVARHAAEHLGQAELTRDLAIARGH